MVEILTHLGIVEKRIAVLVRRMTDGVRRGEPASAAPFEPSAAIAAIEGHGALDRSRKIVAPDAAMPKDELTLDAAWQALAASRAAMRDAVLTGDGLPLAGATTPQGKADLGKALFANSITLTPGTVTVDNEGPRLLVHALVRESAHPSSFASMDRDSARAADGKA